jgi:hypothetical protein
MNDRLNHETAIECLENLMNQVFARRVHDVPSIMQVSSNFEEIMLLTRHNSKAFDV